MREDWRFYTLAGLLLGILVLAYSNHFQNGFHFDDAHTIENNAAIKSLRNIPSFFVDATTFSTRPANQGYRPVFTTLNAIDYWLAGGKLDVFYFHLSIFTSYVVLTVFLYFFLLKILDEVFERPLSRFAALLAAGWFSLHAANAETINYISARSDSFSTLMVIIAFTAYMYLETWRKYHLYLIPIVVGFLVKEPTVIFVPLLFIYVLLFREKVPLTQIFSKKRRLGLVNALRAIAPSVVLAVLLVGFYSRMIPESLSFSDTPRINYLATQTFVVAHYLYNFVLPINLSADTDWTVFTNLVDDRVISGTLLIVALLALVLRTSRKTETLPIAFGILWFLLALAPTSSFIPLWEVLNDHRTFFPYIGLILAAATAAGLLYRKHEAAVSRSLALRSASILAVAGILLGHAYGTHQRNKVWRDGESLWYDVTIKSPRNGRGLMNYGLSQMSKGRYDVALQYFKKAEELVPHYSTLHVNLGILHGARGHEEEARRHFENALRYGPNDPSAYYYYGRWLFERKEYEKSTFHLKKALELSSHHAEAGALLEKVEKIGAGTWTPAIAALNAVERDPSADNYISLSLAYFNEGKFEECIVASRKALELNPNSHLAYNNICAAYNSMKMWEKAVGACRQALRIRPDYTLALNNLNWARKHLNP